MNQHSRHLLATATAPGGKLYTNGALNMQEEAEKLSVNAASIKISNMIESRGSKSSSNNVRRKQL